MRHVLSGKNQLFNVADTSHVATTYAITPRTSQDAYYCLFTKQYLWQ